MDPIVTAMITVYNEETWVERAVRSLLAQTLTNSEVLVVDDGSTDRTPEILDSIGDVRLRVIHCPRAGRAAALAYATTRARGRYIANLDADDEAFPDRLRKQVAFLENHPDHGWVGSAVEREDRQRGEHVARTYPQDDAAIRRQAARCIPYCHSAIMFRRNLVVEGINYDPSQPFLIDFEFFLRVAMQCKVANLPDVLVKRRARDESYFQRTFTAARQDRRLAALCRRAIRQFRLPPWHHVYPAARFAYRLAPTGIKRRVRAICGISETDWSKP